LHVHGSCPNWIYHKSNLKHVIHHDSNSNDCPSNYRLKKTSRQKLQSNGCIKGLSRNFETKNILKDMVSNIHLKNNINILKMQELHRKETFMHVQLFQIKATHLLGMVINIFHCNITQYPSPSYSIDRCAKKRCVI